MHPKTTLATMFAAVVAITWILWPTIPVVTVPDVADRPAPVAAERPVPGVARTEHGATTSGSAVRGSGVPWRVALRRTLRITGRVRDRHGSPVLGAEIVARTNGDPFRAVDAPPTAADGGFVVEVPVPGVYRLSAHKGALRTEHVPVRVAPGGPEVVVELCEVGGYAVEGTVVDAEGAPVPAASVDIWRADPDAGPSCPQGRQVRTDTAGRFSLPLARPGVFRAVARTAGLAPSAVAALRVQERGATVPCVLRLQAFSTIRGRVLDAGGAPLSGLRVSADVGVGTDSGGWPLRRVYGPDPYTNAVTDRDGRFELEHLHPDGRYAVTVFLDPDRYRLRIDRRGVRAGTRDLELIARADDRESGSVQCVVRRSDDRRSAGGAASTCSCPQQRGHRTGCRRVATWRAAGNGRSSSRWSPVWTSGW